MLPVSEVKLDCEGEGVRTISLATAAATAPAGEDVRISSEAALKGDGDLLVVLRG